MSSSSLRTHFSIPFDRNHRRLITGLLLLFSLLVLFKIHSWSLPMWHQVIDQSPALEVMAGHVRDIRSDDWLLDLPMSLAQVSHQSQFPLINQNIGLGQNMLMPIKAPVWAPILLFRPFTWGFFLGMDPGLAWMWWGMVLGLFYGFFLVFMLVSRNQFLLSVLGSLLLVYSPYFQYWSFHKAEIAIHWAFAFVACANILLSRRQWVIWSSGVLLGWSLAGMVLDHIYPPILVSLGWLLPFALLGLVWDRWKEIDWKDTRWTRIGALAIGVVLAAAAGLQLAVSARELIMLISQTTYPGQRFSPGGGYPLWPFFGHNFLAFRWNRHEFWMGNICESATFIFTFPWVMLLVLLGWVQSRRWISVWPVALFGYFALNLSYTYWGLPDWLAKITLMGKATTNRTQMALGVMDVFLLVSLISKKDLASEIKPRLRWLAIALWVILLFYFGYWMHERWPDLKLFHVTIFSILNGALVYLGLVRARWQGMLGILVLVSFLYTGRFNPWIRGGSEYFFKNPLGAKILEIDRSQADRSNWVVYGEDFLQNYMRIIGVHSLGGYHGHPHFELWRFFDPEGKYRFIYNQCAFVVFRLPRHSGEIVFESPSPGVVYVYVDPSSSLFRQLGVNYFLVAGKEAISTFETSGKFDRLFSIPDRTVFRPRRL